MAKLIIIRGNSGSGKTTLAKGIRNKLPKDKTLIVSQDVIRREMLGVKDRKHNLSIKLIQQIVTYGATHCEYVILEGILEKRIYQEMLTEITELFAPNVLVYYFELPFEETLKRHQTRAQVNEFGPEMMEEWWLSNDCLGVKNEYKMNESQNLDTLIDEIIHKLMNLT